MPFLIQCLHLSHLRFSFSRLASVKAKGKAKAAKTKENIFAESKL